MSDVRSAVRSNMAHLQAARAALNLVDLSSGVPLVGHEEPGAMGEVLYMREQLTKHVEAHRRWLRRRAKS